MDDISHVSQLTELLVEERQKRDPNINANKIYGHASFRDKRTI